MGYVLHVGIPLGSVATCFFVFLFFSVSVLLEMKAVHTGIHYHPLACRKSILL